MDERTEIEHILSEHYTIEEAKRWWTSPQERFGGETAETLVASGRSTEVLDALRQLDDCVYL